MVNVRMADKIENIPIQPNHEILPNVSMDARPNAMTAATTTNMAVQAPCVDTAFKAMETPSIPDPTTAVITISAGPRRGLT
jgi:hypothetical protein